jgi:hypothetical protein
VVVVQFEFFKKMRDVMPKSPRFFQRARDPPARN